MPFDFFLGLGGALLSLAMCVSIALSSFRPRSRPPFLSFLFVEASLFFFCEICLALQGPPFLSSALSYCGTLIALPSLYLYGRSTVENVGRGALLHYLPAFINFPLGIAAAALGSLRPGNPLPAVYYIFLTAAQTAQLVAYGGMSLRLARSYGSPGRANWLLRASWAAIVGYALISALGWLLIAESAVEEILKRPIRLFPGIGSFALLAAVFLVWTLCLCALWGGERASAEARAERKYGGRPMDGAEARSLIRGAKRLIAEEPDLSSPRVLPRGLAARLGVPYYLLSRAVNELEGMSVLDLLNRARIERAKARIARDPEADILEACFGSGFGSKSAFNAVFRKFVGMTPSRYRASLEDGSRRK